MFKVNNKDTIEQFNKIDILAQLFSCEFCELFKSTFFKEYLWTTASEFHKTWDIKDEQCTKSF